MDSRLLSRSYIGETIVKSTSMENDQYKLVKHSVSADSSIEICTYENLGEEGMKFVTYKNNKAIGWSSNLSGAFENHDMFAGIHCGLKTEPFFKLISKTRLK